jgi:hypothetical protein
MRSFVALSVIVCVAMAGCRAPCKNTLPPAGMLMHPGPGVDGPGPGVLPYGPGGPGQAATSQIEFRGPEGMVVRWDVSAPGLFDSEPQVCPSIYNFPQAAIYRLKMNNIPGRPGVELYPTLEIGPATPRTEAFLAHNNIPMELTQEDFDQVQAGNFVTKVIYLPDPEFQELALAGVGTLVSTRLDPGVDPIVEADHRGAILAIVRLGNKNLQAPNSHMQEGGVATASYQSPEANSESPAAPLPMGVSGAPQAAPMGVIAGVTAPQYGMPMCGTPIGLPGPPAIPLGVPAGLQKHTIVNHTRVHLPKPTAEVKVVVKQKPGISYPKPADHVRIVERTAKGVGTYRQPLGDRRERVKPAKEECPEGAAIEATDSTDAVPAKPCPTE